MIGKPKFIAVSVGSVLACVLSGCTLGPDYFRPNVKCQLPAGFDLPEGWKLARPGDESCLSEWWQKFDDPELSCLIKSAMAQNFEMAAAFQRVEQARAISDQANGGLFPKLDFDPSVRRGRRSGTLSTGAPNQNGRTTTNIYLPLVMNYEIDLWGRVRREIEAACSETLASLSALRQVKLLLQTEIATQYFQLRATDSEIDIFDRAIALRKQDVELNRKRFEAGDTNEVDVSRAETEWFSTEAQLVQLKQRREQLENALALLAGKPSSGFCLPIKPLEGHPPRIPATVPCDLLERRPDVAQAERIMMAENARIGVAKAAFFPAVSIDGTFGLESGSTAALFNPASRTWAVGAAAMAPVFNGGINKAGLKKAEARYEETVALYRQSILTAVREVDDALVANARLAEQAAAQAKTIQAARRTVELTQSRYRAGIDTYFEVVDALRTALDADQEAVRILSDRYAATIALVRALGGGWDKEACENFIGSE